MSRLAADIAHLDLLEAFGRLGPELRVAVGAAMPDLVDPCFELLVGGARAQDRPQVVAADAEETGEEPALGREARARAVPAERLCDGGDHAHLAEPVAVA